MDDLQESGMVRLFRPYIVKNGKRIYPKKSRCFSFLVPVNKKIAM